MGLDPQLRKLFIQTVTIEPYVSRDGTGKPSYGAPVTYPCRVENQRQARYGEAQVQDVNYATVYLDDVSVSDQDRITLPDGTRPVISGVFNDTDQRSNYGTVIRTWHKRGA